MTAAATPAPMRRPRLLERGISSAPMTSPAERPSVVTGVGSGRVSDAVVLTGAASGRVPAPEVVSGVGSGRVPGREAETSAGLWRPVVDPTGTPGRAKPVTAS